MNIVNCSDYKVGDDVVIQLTGLDIEYYGDVKEVCESQMKVEIPFFHDRVITYTLKNGQQVNTLFKE